MLKLLLVALLQFSARLVCGSPRFWLFDEEHGQFKPNQQTLGIEQSFSPECHMCPQINKTDCMFLPTERTCFAPQIVYYAGHRCLLARVTCHGAYLLIRGSNLITGERDLWDQRVPVNKSKVYHHKWPAYGEEYLARCTKRGFWQISAGIQPYEDVPVAIEKLYCTV